MARGKRPVARKKKPKINVKKKKKGPSTAPRRERTAPKPKGDFVHVDGDVLEALPAGSFKVRLENGHEVLAHLSGRLRRFRIRILPGDRIRVEMTPYDLTKGRIVYRY